MADIKDRTDPFKFPSKRLSAGDLNEMRESMFRQVLGSGSARVRKYGDRLLVDGDEGNNPWQYPFMSCAVRTVYSDYILCAPIILAPGVGRPYDPSLGTVGVTSQQMIAVAKPYLLQVTPWDNQQVALGDLFVTYQYQGASLRLASSPNLPNEFQALTPYYITGELITARFGPTGLSDASGSGHIMWTDTNEGGRQWAAIT